MTYSAPSPVKKRENIFYLISWLLSFGTLLRNPRLTFGKESCLRRGDFTEPDGGGGKRRMKMLRVRCPSTGREPRRRATLGRWWYQGSITIPKLTYRQAGESLEGAAGFLKGLHWPK